MAWIDSDLLFLNENWVCETIHQLQHYPVVQLFQTAIDLGPDGHAMKIYEGIGYLHNNNNFLINNTNKKYDVAHPGYAWACTREMWNLMGGLIEFPILGAADRHMAFAFIGYVEKTLPKQLNEVYKNMARQFQERIKTKIGELGYIDGTIVHSWHGKKKDRRYVERWGILIKHDYNPETDIRKNWQGVIELNYNKPEFKQDLMKYFILRNEDTIDME